MTEVGSRLSNVPLDMIERRMKNRATRLARFMELRETGSNLPTFVVAQEVRLLDEAVAEWKRRMQAAGEWLGDDEATHGG
jgi:hypothetical protein